MISKTSYSPMFTDYMLGKNYSVVCITSVNPDLDLRFNAITHVSHVQPFVFNQSYTTKFSFNTDTNESNEAQNEDSERIEWTHAFLFSVDWFVVTCRVRFKKRI